VAEDRTRGREGMFIGFEAWGAKDDDAMFKNWFILPLGVYNTGLLPSPSSATLSRLHPTDDDPSLYDKFREYDLRVLPPYRQPSPFFRQGGKYHEPTSWRGLVVSKDLAIVGSPPKEAGDHH
jgi:hypothetical protein